MTKMTPIHSIFDIPMFVLDILSGFFSALLLPILWAGLAQYSVVQPDTTSPDYSTRSIMSIGFGILVSRILADLMFLVLRGKHYLMNPMHEFLFGIVIYIGYLIAFGYSRNVVLTISGTTLVFLFAIARLMGCI